MLLLLLFYFSAVLIVSIEDIREVKIPKAGPFFLSLRAKTLTQKQKQNLEMALTCLVIIFKTKSDQVFVSQSQNMISLAVLFVMVFRFVG